MIAGGSIAAQGFAVAISPVLTRLYTPADFGALALFSSTLLIVSVVASWRYEIAIPLPDRDEDARNLLALALVLVAVTAGCLTLVLALAARPLAALVSDQTPTTYLWLVPAGVLGLGWYQALTYWAVRRGAYRRLAETKLIQGASLVVTQLGLGVLQVGAVGLVAGDLVGRSAGLGRLGKAVRTDARGATAGLSWRRTRELAWRYRRFPLISSGSAVLNVAGLQIPALLILILYGPVVGGLFALAQRVLSVPLALLGQAVMQVYVGHAGELIRSGDKLGLSALFSRFTRRLVIISALPVAILGAAGPILFTVVFGEAWRAAGEYAQIMILMVAAQLCVNPLAHTLMLLEFQGWQMAWDVSRLLLVLASFLAAGLFGLPPSTTIALYAGVITVTYLALHVMCRAAIARY